MLLLQQDRKGDTMKKAIIKSIILVTLIGFVISITSSSNHCQSAESQNERVEQVEQEVQEEVDDQEELALQCPQTTFDEWLKYEAPLIYPDELLEVIIRANELLPVPDGESICDETIDTAPNDKTTKPSFM